MLAGAGRERDGLCCTPLGEDVDNLLGEAAREATRSGDDWPLELSGSSFFTDPPPFFGDGSESCSRRSRLFVSCQNLAGTARPLDAGLPTMPLPPPVAESEIPELLPDDTLSVSEVETSAPESMDARIGETGAPLAKAPIFSAAKWSRLLVSKLELLLAFAGHRWCCSSSNLELSPSFPLAGEARRLSTAGDGQGSGFLTGSEKDSPWKETDKLRVVVPADAHRAFAAGQSPEAETERRRRSADCARF